MTPAATQYAVAASGTWRDDETGTRLPDGDVHAWTPGRNETLCGLSLHRSQLTRFAHVAWPDILPESGGAADRVRRVCPRCRAGTGTGAGRPRWNRRNPRP